MRARLMLVVVIVAATACGDGGDPAGPSSSPSSSSSSCAPGYPGSLTTFAGTIQSGQTYEYKDFPDGTLSGTDYAGL